MLYKNQLDNRDYEQWDMISNFLIVLKYFHNFLGLSWTTCLLKVVMSCTTICDKVMDLIH